MLDRPAPSNPATDRRDRENAPYLARLLSGEPAIGRDPRGRPDYRDRHRGERRRRHPVPLGTPVRGLARSRPAATLSGRQGTAWAHLETRRRVYQAPVGARRARPPQLVTAQEG